MKNGFILILTLVVISLLTIGVVGFNYWVRTKNISANNQIFDLKTLYLAKAGINYGIFVLQDDEEKKCDNLNEDWAKIEPFNLGEGVVTVKITDEKGKINLNKLIDEKDKKGETINKIYKKILENLFTVLELETNLLPPIYDWLDSDSTPKFDGAEEDYYTNLNSPYSCKNGPLDTIGELIMIKGMSKEILYNDGNGLVNFLTVVDNSGSEININTAPLEVLEAILNNRSLAEDIIDRREEEPFTNVAEIGKFFHEKRISDDKKNLFTCKSNFFSLESTGTIPPHYKKSIRAIVDRNSNSLKIPYYKVE